MRTHPTLFAVVLLGTALPGFFVPAQAESPSSASGPSMSGPTISGNARGWSLRQTPVVDVVRRVKDAVVNIHSERTVRAPGADELFNMTPSQSRVNGMGTGIVIDPRGYIITNQHVVDEVSLLRVRLADGTTLAARVLARDTESDLALLKINPPKPLAVMPLGTTQDLQVGETVVAIGNAYGYDHTVTVGVVSALGRDVTLNREVRYRSLIQTDASINPGNSGGPLINLHGDLVGVNVAIRAGAQGIGFAIPVDNMIKVASNMLAQIRLRGNVGPLGLTVRDDLGATPAIGSRMDHPILTRRVVVDTIESSAAGKAGLRKGDEVVKVGDLPVGSSLDVQRGLLDREGGGRIELLVRRAGGEHKIELTLESAPPGSSPAGQEFRDGRTTGGLASTAGSPNALVWRSLGLRLSPVSNPTEVSRTHPQLHGGLVIGEVRPDGPASRAGLRPGDVLVGLHQWEMLNLENVRFVLEHPDRHTFSPLRFFILRAGQVHRGSLQPD